jgi:SAM-dependent methyltransferase
MWSIPLSRQPELMDDPALPAADHVHALEALARINAFSFTAARIAAAAARLLAAAGHSPPQTRPVELLDVACGGGEVTAAVARRLARRSGGRGVRALGIDMSPRALEHARQNAGGGPDGPTVEFAVRDVVAAGCPECDIAFCSLFLHHLDDAAAAAVLAAMAAAARVGVVVSDLVRSPTGLVLARIGTLVLSRSRVARVDGPLSVRAARTPAEYRDLLAGAGLAGATVRGVWPERVMVEWPRPATTLPRETQR